MFGGWDWCFVLSGGALEGDLLLEHVIKDVVESCARTPVEWRGWGC